MAQLSKCIVSKVGHGIGRNLACNFVKPKFARFHEPCKKAFSNCKSTLHQRIIKRCGNFCLGVLMSRANILEQTKT